MFESYKLLQKKKAVTYFLLFCLVRKIRRNVMPNTYQNSIIYLNLVESVRQNLPENKTLKKLIQ